MFSVVYIDFEYKFYRDDIRQVSLSKYLVKDLSNITFSYLPSKVDIDDSLINWIVEKLKSATPIIFEWDNQRIEFSKKNLMRSRLISIKNLIEADIICGNMKFNVGISRFYTIPLIYHRTKIPTLLYLPDDLDHLSDAIRKLPIYEHYPIDESIYLAIAVCRQMLKIEKI